MINYNPYKSVTPVVLNLIIINVLVFVAQLALKNLHITELFALYPYNSGFFKPYQLVTHLFTHSPVLVDGFLPLHILLNMYGLWMFGCVLERVWGPWRFLLFYFICGFAAGLTQMFLTDVAAIGASGAVMGLVG